MLPLCIKGPGPKPADPKNPDVALLTNTQAYACYCCWQANTPLANTNTVHIYIYLRGGSDTEPTIEETIEHQSQQAEAEKAVCLTC